MDKKSIILLVAIILIVGLAIIVGKNLANKPAEPANTNPTSSVTATPNRENVTPTPEETASTEPTETPKATPSPVPTPSQNKDISQMTEKQKEDYAKSIAKSSWEKTGMKQKVFYDSTANSEIYRITVRDEATTNMLITYEVNIKTGSCKLIESNI